MIQGDLATHVQSLLSERTPFVLATVVRARRPTSVRPGNAAVVLPDGSMEGFVGGVCAESSVRLHALRAMETGDPLLLRLVPQEGDADGVDAIEGAVVERNPCLSGGALEIFIEPHLPAARLVIVGGSPIAEAIVAVAKASGYDILRAPAGTGARPGGVESVELAGAAAVIVASHGNSEEAMISEALRAGVSYVALVASPKRGAAVRSELDVPEELAAQLHTPAGLNIGARTPAEIAISILAQMVECQHADPVPGRPEASAPAPALVAVATDPVCGMQVAITAAAPRLEVAGDLVYFCCDGCRDRYAADHADDLAAHHR
ncbi:MAG TPA: XdhC family protein [Solirubrobacteraceae bacterium]|jgi:xanthine dehydrogenase accessory factor|nr:XdhC family protein [Solirubrobacteraceae bacterium]